ncbi:MAG: carbamoyl phosphate synthase small subunit [Campylobacteraceae bacterium 4484_166]|nr:MAG: carbamoyl phosphate synthase small subunit [Campylobacteraceae bacterium 4484_166]
MKKEKIWIYLENGDFFEANSFGCSGETVGELVFNTSMTGYQEILSDPSYAGQFVTFNFPEIGNVGVNEHDMQSSRFWCKGVIVHNYSESYSNYRATNSLSAELKKFNTIGICDIDTRKLVKIVREQGVMMMIASTNISDKDILKELLERSPKIKDINFIDKVSTKKSYIHNEGIWCADTQKYNKAKRSNKKIIVIDFGVKRAILNELVHSGFEVEVINANFDADDIILKYNQGKIDGLFLSNGPGDPMRLTEQIVQIKKLIKTDIPIFAICLGHQLLSIAFGHDTYKLKFGQHGGNHPVFSNQKVEITAQNHNYNVPKTIEQVAHITHYNLFDKTIEGVQYKNKNIFSVQHHPEANPGPKESSYIFKKFNKLCDKPAIKI